MARRGARAVERREDEVQSAPEASGNHDVVTVACNTPSGIVIRGMRKATRTVNVLGGGQRLEEYFEPDGREVTIFGNSAPAGGLPRTRVVVGYALTENVPKDLWDEWVEANAALPMVKNRLIFAYKSTAGAVDMAREHKGTRSGLEPLRREKDERVPRPVNKSVSPIQQSDEVSP